MGYVPRYCRVSDRFSKKERKAQANRSSVNVSEIPISRGENPVLLSKDARASKCKSIIVSVCLRRRRGEEGKNGTRRARVGCTIFSVDVMGENGRKEEEKREEGKNLSERLPKIQQTGQQMGCLT